MPKNLPDHWFEDTDGQRMMSTKSNATTEPSEEERTISHWVYIILAPAKVVEFCELRLPQKGSCKEAAIHLY